MKILQCRYVRFLGVDDTAILAYVLPNEKPKPLYATFPTPSLMAYILNALAIAKALSISCFGR